MSAAEITLSLRAPFRRLYISVKHDGWIYVSAGTVPRKKFTDSKTIATAVGRLNRPDSVRFAILWNDKSEAALWVGGASFDISAAEATRLEETYASHGLKVERAESAS